MKCLCLMIVLITSGAAYGQPDGPYEAKAKRAARDRAATKINDPAGREFIERLGEYAVAACNGCSPAACAKLAKLHASGELNLLPSPADLLLVIGQVGQADAIVDFVCGHIDELHDKDRFAVFLREPMTYALAIRSLDAGVANMKRQKEREGKEYESKKESEDKERMAGIYAGGIVAVVMLVIWLIFRRRAY